MDPIQISGMALLALFIMIMSYFVLVLSRNQIVRERSKGNKIAQSFAIFVAILAVIGIVTPAIYVIFRLNF